MRFLQPSDIAEARVLRRIDMAVGGGPYKGVNGPGNNPPSIDETPGRGWTLYRHPIKARVGRILLHCPDDLLERANSATAAQVRTWLAARGVDITLAQAARLKALVAAAVEEPDEAEGDGAAE